MHDLTGLERNLREVTQDPITGQSQPLDRSCETPLRVKFNVSEVMQDDVEGQIYPPMAFSIG
jgi:hypothetical protein